MKSRTFRQVEATKQKAENFTRNVLGDDERADEIAAESVEDYAERKRLTIENPSLEGRKMSTKRERELLEENKAQATMIEELETELDTLRGAVSKAAALLPDEDEDESDEESDDEDEDEDEEDQD